MPAATIAIPNANGNGSSSGNSTNAPMVRPVSVRMTRPDYYSPYATGGGVGVVPRRGWDEKTRLLITQVNRGEVSVQSWAAEVPLRLLDVMLTLHPLGKRSQQIRHNIAFKPGDTRFVAVANENDREADPEGTAALEALWRSLPREIGGHVGLRRAMARQADSFGMSCVEAVPAGVGAGLMGIYTFHPLTTRYWDTEDGRRVLQQKASSRTPKDAYSSSGKDSGWIDLDPATCLATAVDGDSDNPHGSPILGAFVQEGLTDIGEQSNLKDVMRAIAWPHLATKFPINEVVKYAQENPEVLVGLGADGGDMSPLEYAYWVYEQFVAVMPGLKADDTINLPAGADIEMISGATALTGIGEMLDRRILRVCNALCILPSLLGYTFGGTQAYSEAQWNIMATELEALRDYANAVVCEVGNLHLRLLGMNLICRADTKPIKKDDVLKNEQAEAIKIENVRKKVQAGFMSVEDASYELTGSAVEDKDKAQKWAEAQAALTPDDPSPNPEPDDDDGGDDS